MNRRNFLLGALGLGTAWPVLAAPARKAAPLPMCRGARPLAAAAVPSDLPARPPLHPEALARYVDALPIPPLLQPAGFRADPSDPKGRLPWYRLDMRACEVQVHRDLAPTPMWGYGGTVPGPTIAVRSGQGILVEWGNALPARHFLPIDHSLCGAGPEQPEVRAVVHVHGGRTPAASDGYPEDWTVPGGSRQYHYPNRQDAATLWYHDHTMGIERLNQYAGLFGLYLVRDAHEDSLNLPAGPYEVPLVLCDRLFGADGQLRYPVSSVPGAPWVSEVYGDCTLVNGKLFPYLEVEPRLYRLRLLNAANSRLFLLALSGGCRFYQIGTDQGFLGQPVPLERLSLAPAERADLLVDFSALAGQQVLLQDQNAALMQFRVAGNGPGRPAALPRRLRDVPPLPRAAAVRRRVLTLDEYMDPGSHRMLMLLNGSYWSQPVTERPRLGSVEIWEFVNTTEDTHPIHLHLVRFQLLERQAYDADEFNTSGRMLWLAQPVPPAPAEAGWKDTIQAHPGMVTRIIVRFEGYAGRYVWHCHLLEHAANEMMRPYEVLA